MRARRLHPPVVAARWALTAAVLGVAALGCAKETPPARQDPATPAPSAEVWRGDGVTLTTRCTYHPNRDPNAALEEIGKTLPPGSVDAIFLEALGEARTLVVVEVQVEPNAPSGPAKFTTTFRIPSGVEIQKAWEGSPQNKSGTYRSIVSVPLTAKHVGTRTRG